MTAYDDLDSPQTMRDDAAVAGARLPAIGPRLAYADLFSGYPTDPPKPQVEVTEAAQRIVEAVYG